MRLTIDGKLRDLIPIKTFRASHALPDQFGIAAFEPKDFAGLAAIDNGGAEMNELRQGMLNMLPETIALPDALTLADTLQAVFRNGLYGINTSIGLKMVEIEYAVAGFGDVLRDWLYALIRAKSAKSAAPDFRQIYGHWLDSSTRLSQQAHDYPHNQSTWHINLINNAYGRVGLRVAYDEHVDYVQDSVYTCPAEGYMALLLQDIAVQIAVSLALEA